jgi:hypothetical protein
MDNGIQQVPVVISVIRLNFYLEGETDAGRMIAQGRGHSAPQIGSKVLLNLTHHDGKRYQYGVFEVLDVIYIYEVAIEEQIAAWSERFEAGAMTDRGNLPINSEAEVIVRKLGNGPVLKVAQGL